VDLMGSSFRLLWAGVDCSPFFSNFQWFWS
jgi:hypothetical protein